MAEEILGKFRFIVLTPLATLLDCTTHSVTLPAHDGQIGIWRDHMPMLCRLGLGIMEVRDLVAEENQAPSDKSFVIDGGFVRISRNVVMVLAYDVVEKSDTNRDKAQKFLDDANKLSGDTAQIMNQRQHDLKKASLLMQICRPDK
jgi:F-type H+-transporting ATPase subunit epsilon